MIFLAIVAGFIWIVIAFFLTPYFTLMITMCPKNRDYYISFFLLLAMGVIMIEHYLLRYSGLVIEGMVL